MINPDFTKLSRKQLMEYFEQERQEWLAAGMNEADIFRIHFGEAIEKGRGGDYRIWLNERQQVRPDHKYAPGTPVAIDTVDPNGALICDGCRELEEAEIQIDFNNALSTLTELQKYSIIEVCIKGRSCRDVAREQKKHHSTVAEAVKAAKEKIKKYF